MAVECRCEPRAGYTCLVCRRIEDAREEGRRAGLIEAAEKNGVHCHFCGETGFDLIGLKLHFERGWCDAYNNLVAKTTLEDAIEARAKEPASRTAERDARQAKAGDWTERCFATSMDRQERARRMLEEANEGAQAVDVSREMAHRIVDYVHDKPKGEVRQEIGGIGITLLAFAHACGVSADEAERDELTRVLSKPLDHFRARGAIKAQAGIEGGAVVSTAEEPANGE